MKKKRKFLSPITILMIVIVIAAGATWIVPAGRYNTLSYSDNRFKYDTDTGEIILPFNKHTLDSLSIFISPEKFSSGSIRKAVAVPATFHLLPGNSQGALDILEAPIKGIIDAVEIILFLLIIGGFMNVFHETGAIVKGLKVLSFRMKGKEAWLIIILTFLFSFAGSSYGMAEEALVFYPVLVPLFLAVGYDLLVPVVVIFGGTQLGTLSSFTNPFSTIIASNAAGVNWTDGITERIVLFAVSTAITIWYVVRYAQKVKKDPTQSIIYKVDGEVNSPYETIKSSGTAEPLTGRNTLLLILFLSTFLVMIIGVVWFDWWLIEMSALFLGASILIALITRTRESQFINQFLKGAESLLAVAFIVGVARGVTIILNEGHISDSILFYCAKLVSGMHSGLFIVMLMVLFMIFTLFISSSSGMAVLTMPIIGGLAVIVNVPGREIVNAYLYGMGIMGFLTPTGLILPSLSLVNVSVKAWWKFMYPLLIILFIVCSLFLVIGIYLK